jgi:hypothetical protein
VIPSSPARGIAVRISRAREQDIRGAIGRPGARDTEEVRLSADLLLAALSPPVPLRVAVEDAEFRVGPPGAADAGAADAGAAGAGAAGAAGAGAAGAAGAGLGLRTSRFEALRWRMGRRSRAQLAKLDWTGDPAPLLDHLVVFGPAARDITE